MSPLEALNDVCREFCAADQHDDACITLRGVVNQWAALVICDSEEWRP